MRLSKYTFLLIASTVFVSACTGGADTVELEPGPAPPPVNVSVVGGNTVDEGILNGMLGFQITLSEASASHIDVTVETRAGSATEGTDFLARSESIAIPAGVTSADIDVAILGDSADEPDETVHLDITAVSSGRIDVATAAGTIIDDDAPATVSISDASIVEGETGQSVVSFSVALNTPSGFDVSAEFATANGSALAGQDYDAASGQVTIPAGSTLATIDIGINGDAVDEGDEAFSITLSNPDNASLGKATATGTIVNDDAGVPPPVIVSVSGAGSAVESPAGSALSFPITLSVGSAVDIDVVYQTVGGTASAGVDFVAQSSSVTIPAGSTAVPVNVAVIDDALDEPDESLSLQILSVSSGTIGTSVANGIIVDDDLPAPVTVSVSSAGSTAESAGGSALSFPITLSAASTTDIDVLYQTVAGTATAGVDYVAQSSSVTVAAGATSVTVDVAVVDDTLDEPDEDLSLQILSVSSGTIGTALVTGTIVDDDPLPSLSISDAAIAEGDAGQTSLAFTVSLDTASGFDVSVDYQSVNGTATAGSDYIATAGVATIAAGGTSTVITVAIVGDTDEENDETFTLGLSSSVNATIADASATGTITNDDAATPVTVSVSSAGSTAESAGGSALSFPITLSAASTTDIDVLYQTVAGTATAGVDYVAQSSSVTVAAGATSVTVDVAVVDDTLDEPDEDLSLQILSVSSGTIGTALVTGTIVDDDPLPSLSISDAAIAEGDAGQTSLAFTVSLDTASGFDVSVDYQSVNGTATAGSDYIATAGVATIAAGGTSTVITVAIVGDTDEENDETFTLGLSSSVNATIADASATGTITNDDAATPVTVSVSSAGSTAESAGGSALSFPITLSAASTTDIDVLYQTVAGTATAGVDYVAQSSSVTVAAGATSVTVDVAVVDDTLDEPDEDLSLQILSVSSGTIGTALVTGTIVDDDPLPSLSISDAAIAEGDAGQTSLAFTVSLDTASGFDVSVDYQSVNGTATAGSDYIATAGVATIAAGGTSTVITVAIVGDTDEENDETFTLGLSSSVNATIADASATGTITNDDAATPVTVSVSSAGSTAESAGGSALSFPITLSAASTTDIDVLYQTVAGTATAGVDYVAQSSSVTVAAGATSVTVDVAVVDDTLDEPDEDLSLQILSVSSGTIGTALVTGTIVDDDPLPSLSISDAAIAEGDAGQTSLAFTVSLDTASGFDVSVDYQSVNGTATAGSDYIATAGVATIAAGGTSTVITVAIVGDTDEENDETFTLGLSSSVNATIADASATGTISNDDASQASGLASRPSNLTCIAPDRPILNTSIDTENAFPSLPSFNKPVGLLQLPGDTSQWFVIEKNGRVLRFDNSLGVSSVSTFIDIRSPSDPIDVDAGASESGLLGMAFHPDYGIGNWFVYLSYTIDGAGTGGPFVSVITRFESKDNGLTLDATDATQLITLNQPASNHNGGQITFGPDGFLYITFGDGGPGHDPDDRAQNTNNLYGAMLRIDVDSGSPYAIPGDNPFFGGALCNAGTGTAACPEIYAWGLRNAWKWSFDDETNQLWLGDVGQASWEEIDLIELGGNYGWRCREGAHNKDLSGVCPAGLIDPVIEYSHGVGDSVTGGYVYRGTAIPELIGRYVFGDYVRGKIFASADDDNGGYTYEQLLNTSFFISAFVPEDDGELLFLDYSGGDIHRIIQSGGNSNEPIPDQLSATGCVNAANPSQPASGLIPYDINVPFWSDGAAKGRWYAIPDNTSIDVAADGDWIFPIGSVLMKDFRLNNQLIETRLLMRHPDGEWAGYTYEWNTAGTDATRVVGGKTKNVAGQDWIYPSGSECQQCHTQPAGFSLGPEHGQLNKDFTYPTTGITANQLFTADTVDLLTSPLTDTPDNLQRFVDPTDVAESLEDRARSYLHSNCAGCHRPGGPTPSNMDLRYPTSLQNTNTCDVAPVSGPLGIPGARIIAPGSSAASLLVNRASRRDIHGMPPLGSNLIDVAGVQLLSDWINSLVSCP